MSRYKLFAFNKLGVLVDSTTVDIPDTKDQPVALQQKLNIFAQYNYCTSGLDEKICVGYEQLPVEPPELINAISRIQRALDGYPIMFIDPLDVRRLLDAYKKLV